MVPARPQRASQTGTGADLLFLSPYPSRPVPDSQSDIRRLGKGEGAKLSGTRKGREKRSIILSNPNKSELRSQWVQKDLKHDRELVALFVMQHRPSQP